MSDFKIHIPAPCSENWDTMQPNEKGRFCTTCNTTVVDFTAMNANEIKNYFIAKAGQKICGHYRVSQTVQPPEPAIHRILYKWYAHVETQFKNTLLKTAVLVILSTLMVTVGCNNVRTTGEPAPVTDSTKLSGDTLATNPDTATLTGAPPEQTLTGEAPMIEPIIKKKDTLNETLVVGRGA